MSANGAEQRFWVYFDTANETRNISDIVSAAADQSVTLLFNTRVPPFWT